MKKVKNTTKGRKPVGRARQIRFHPETERMIEELSKELNEPFSQVVRELVGISLTILHLSDKITLRDILLKIREEFSSSPYYLDMLEIEGDEDEDS